MYGRPLYWISNHTTVVWHAGGESLILQYWDDVTFVDSCLLVWLFDWCWFDYSLARLSHILSVSSPRLSSVLYNSQVCLPPSTHDQDHWVYHSFWHLKTFFPQKKKSVFLDFFFYLWHFSIQCQMLKEVMMIIYWVVWVSTCFILPDVFRELNEYIYA